MFETNCYDEYGNKIDKLYQWDLSQIIRIQNTGLTVAPIVMFGNECMTEAYTVLSTISNGTVTVAIPNCILQQASPITVYLNKCDSSDGQIGRTICTVRIPVQPRQKPSDYKYVENINSYSVKMLESSIDTRFNNKSSSIDVIVNNKMKEIDSSVATAISDMNSTADTTIENKATEFGNQITQAISDMNAGVGSSINTKFKEVDKTLSGAIKNYEAKMDEEIVYFDEPLFGTKTKLVVGTDVFVGSVVIVTYDTGISPAKEIFHVERSDIGGYYQSMSGSGSIEYTVQDGDISLTCVSGVSSFSNKGKHVADLKGEVSDLKETLGNITRLNLLNNDNCLIGKTVNYSINTNSSITLDNLIDSSSVICSEIFKCKSGEKYTFNKRYYPPDSTFIFANSDKVGYGLQTYPSCVVYNGDATWTVTIPEGVFYFRWQFTYNDTGWSGDGWKTKAMICKGENLPKKYYSYDAIVIDNLVGDEKLETDVETLKTGVANVKNEIDITQNMVSFIPSSLYLIKGTKRSTALENVVFARNKENFYIKSTDAYRFNRKRQNIADATRVDALSVCNSITDKGIKSQNYNLTRLDYTQYSNPSTVKNVLIIGDSYSDQGWLPCYIKDQIVNVAGFSNVSFIGNKSDEKELYTGNTVNCNNCGNGGYSIYDYLKTDNSQGRGSGFPNPFLIEGDISLSGYISKYSLPSPDLIILELGVNNKFTTGHSGIAEIENDIKSLIDIIHSDYPNCKILLVGLIYASDYNNSTEPLPHNIWAVGVNELYQNVCVSAEYSSFCTYVDVGFTFDMDYGFQYEDGKPYNGYYSTVRVQTDWLHPSECGYYMIGENIVSALVTKLLG